MFQPGTIAYDDLPELDQTQNAAVASTVGMMMLPAVDDPKITLLQGPADTTCALSVLLLLSANTAALCFKARENLM